jgi:ribosomal protein S4
VPGRASPTRSIRRANWSRTNLPVAHQARAGAIVSSVPRYLDVDRDQLRIAHVRRARREEIPVTCDEQLVVEYYAAR